MTNTATLALQTAAKEIQEQGANFQVSKEIYQSYPATDIQGKFTDSDFMFSERLERVRTNTQLRTGAVQGFLQQLQNSQEFKSMEVEARSISLESAVYRLAGEKLTEEPETASRLKAQALKKETDIANTPYAKAVSVLEYFSASGPQPMPDWMKSFCDKELKCPIPKQAEQERGKRRSGISGIGFHFQSDEARYERENNGKDAPEAPMDYAPEYLAKTVSRVIEPLYRSTSDRLGKEISTDNMIFIKGDDDKFRSVQELGTKWFQANRPNEGWTQQERVQKQKELLGAALMSNQRVIGFAPDGESGKLKPMVFSNDGYEPTPLKPVHMNRWQRFWSEHGDFYQQKKRQYEEYLEATKAAEIRQQELENELYGVDRNLVDKANKGLEIRDFADKVPVVKEFMKFAQDYTSKQQMEGRTMAMQMFGDQANNTAGADVPNNNCYRLGRTGITRGVMVMLGQGYNPEDIMDPNKLVTQKAEAGKTLLEMRDRDDRHEYAAMANKGMGILAEKARGFQMDYTSRASIMEHQREIEFFLMCHDNWQEMNQSSPGGFGVKEAMQDIYINQEREKSGLPPHTRESHEAENAWKESLSPKEREASDLCEILGKQEYEKFDDNFAKIYGPFSRMKDNLTYANVTSDINSLCKNMECDRIVRESLTNDAAHGKGLLDREQEVLEMKVRQAEATISASRLPKNQQEWCEVYKAACEGKPLSAPVEKKGNIMMQESNEFKQALHLQPVKAAAPAKAK